MYSLLWLAFPPVETISFTSSDGRLAKLPGLVLAADDMLVVELLGLMFLKSDTGRPAATLHPNWVMYCIYQHRPDAMAAPGTKSGRLYASTSGYRHDKSRNLPMTWSG